MEAAAALKLTAPDLLAFGVIDEIVPEPIGGAHNDAAAAAALLDTVLSRTLASVSSLSSRERLDQRYEKFRNMGRLGLEFADESAR